MKIFFLYGPYEHPKRLISYVIRSLIKGEPALCSSGDQNRDFLYVEDVASGFVALLENEITGIVNIGSGESVLLRNVVETIGEKIGCPELIRLGVIPSRPDDPTMLVADASKLRQEVGWTPRFNLDRGLDQTIEWWKGLL